MQTAVEMEYLADVGSAGDQLGTSCLDVINDQHHSLCRAWGNGREPASEHDRTWRSVGRQMHHPPPGAVAEVSVEPPAETQIKGLGTLDVGNRNHDDFELQINA